MIVFGKTNDVNDDFNYLEITKLDKWQKLFNSN